MDRIKSDHTPREIANGFRQFDLVVEIIQYYLHPERPFALRPHLILDLQQAAVSGIEVNPGQFRTTSVSISQSKHLPPEAYLIASLTTDFCDVINDNWHERSAFYLSAYTMWRLNWIHAFSDGNGRTSRALSYIILCLKLGYALPGTPTIPQQIEEDKAHYIEALENADDAYRSGWIDVSVMENMIKGMLARQLLGVIDAASTATS